MFMLALALLPVYASLSTVLAAPTPSRLSHRQNINLCTPDFQSGTKYAIQSADDTSLFWNATFPTRDYKEAFTDVKLQKRINDDPTSVSLWSFSTVGEYNYKQISSRVPEDSPWFVGSFDDGSSIRGAQSSNLNHTQYSISCNYDDEHNCNTYCSIRTAQTYPDDGQQACLSSDAKRGSQVVVGRSSPGPYDCDVLVNFVAVD